jgi:hypothetical protein
MRCRGLLVVLLLSGAIPSRAQAPPDRCVALDELCPNPAALSAGPAEEPHGLPGDGEGAGRGEGRANVLAALPRSAGRHALNIIVHVYDYARVSRATLAQAEEEATKIFNIAMIRVTWVGCQPRTIAMAGDSRCRPPFGSADFVLRILPRSGFTHPDFGDRTLGFALPSTEARGGTMATVFYDRVERLVKSADPSLSHVLALVSAHEIGHLMLPPAGHSAWGIMCDEWTPNDLQAARSPYLVFTPEQSRLMRENVSQEDGARWRSAGISATPPASRSGSEDRVQFLVGPTGSGPERNSHRPGGDRWIQKLGKMFHRRPRP